MTTTEKETRTRAEAVGLDPASVRALAEWCEEHQAAWVIGARMKREDGRAATLRLQQLCELLLRPMPAPSDAAATELERR